MWTSVVIVLACAVHSGRALWACTTDSQCTDVAGAVCSAGVCACPFGQQVINGRCVDLAIYHAASCVEDHQCSRLFVAFECRKEEDSEEGVCRCQDGFHYFHGRCWRSAGFGQPCTQQEECIDIPRDPYSLACTGACVCADGYYLRQRGECRKIGYAVGEGCVLDEDCQFDNGVCEIETLSCQLNTETRNSTNSKTASSPLNVTSDVKKVTSDVRNVTNSVRSVTARTHGSSCPCDAPFECESGSCVCPVGYYGIGNGGICFAELGSPSTEEQCGGILAQVEGGVCKCPPNFFYEENMRDCIRVTRRITDSCATDDNCLTYGVAALCGPADPALWGQRSCVCDTEHAVWDASRQMCRLFAGVGEACQIDSDCLAGELEIQCVVDESGEGQCTCPEGLLTVDGLCLTTGLAIGEACQSSQECTETPNTACISGRCSCDSGYQQEGDLCAPIIGGTCEEDGDCVIAHTACHGGDAGVRSCQCVDSHVAYNETCWQLSPGFEGACEHSIQCTASLGEDSLCVAGRCACSAGFHHRDGGCWPITALFQSCSRTSQCYLAASSERVECRNSLCQCQFDFPYSEAERTCVSSANSAIGSIFVIITALIYLASS